MKIEDLQNQIVIGRYFLAMNGPLKGECVRIPRGLREWTHLVPVELHISFSEPLEPVTPFERKEVIYRPLNGGYIVYRDMGQIEEWSIDGHWDREMMNDFFSSFAYREETI